MKDKEVWKKQRSQKRHKTSPPSRSGHSLNPFPLDAEGREKAILILSHATSGNTFPVSPGCMVHGGPKLQDFQEKLITECWNLAYLEAILSKLMDEEAQSVTDSKRAATESKSLTEQENSPTSDS